MLYNVYIDKNWFKYISNGNHTYTDIFYLFDSRYKQTLADALWK